MKRLLGTLVVVVALGAFLAIPASAAKTTEVAGMWITDSVENVTSHSVGTDEDDHYCMIAMDLVETLTGDIEGKTYEHLEILNQRQ